MYKKYKVGGYVRDILLNITPSDTDYVIIGHTPESYEATYPTHKKVGLSFPVYINNEGNEEALGRIEHSTGQSTMDFDCISNATVTLEQDLFRRDLTINSMAMDENGAVIDPYNGQEDIKNKYLRHTSNAFIEDPIRVLRLARFKTLLPDFTIHKTTRVLVYQMRDQLTTLQPDRVWKEVEKALNLPNSYIFFETLFSLGVLDCIFPQIYKMTTCKEGSKYHQEASVFEHSMRVMQSLDYNIPIYVKIAALYHDIAKPNCYNMYGTANGHENLELVEPLIDMQLPASIKKKVLHLIDGHLNIYRFFEMSDRKAAKFIASYKEETILYHQLQLGDADRIGRISVSEKPKLKYLPILDAWHRISSYSPSEYIKANGITSGEAIKQHIHRYNIQCIKDIRHEIS